MTDQIKEFIEEETEDWAQDAPDDGEAYERILRRAIAFGLSLAEGVGPAEEGPDDIPCYCSRHDKNCTIDAITAKNSAIRTLREQVKKERYEKTFYPLYGNRASFGGT